mmetsp:Transcript_62189/g.165139  ORF Transcript_62189/g.165139 Transcript_62189/m.165139 type:complete len:295 (+) Transcript_62189:628-1512(+)
MAVERIVPSANSIHILVIAHHEVATSQGVQQRALGFVTHTLPEWSTGVMHRGFGVLGNTGCCRGGFGVLETTGRCRGWRLPCLFSKKLRTTIGTHETTSSVLLQEIQQLPVFIADPRFDFDVDASKIFGYTWRNPPRFQLRLLLALCINEVLRTSVTRRPFHSDESHAVHDTCRHTSVIVYVLPHISLIEHSSAKSSIIVSVSRLPRHVQPSPARCGFRSGNTTYRSISQKSNAAKVSFASPESLQLRLMASATRSKTRLSEKTSSREVVQVVSIWIWSTTLANFGLHFTRPRC